MHTYILTCIPIYLHKCTYAFLHIHVHISIYNNNYNNKNLSPVGNGKTDPF